MHVDGSFQTQGKIIYCQTGSIKRKMHGVQIHGQRRDEFNMQTIRIGLALQRSTYVLRIQREQHVVPTLSFRRQFSSAKRCRDSVLVVHKSDVVSLQPQPVHAQSVERKRERRGVRFGGVRRRDKHIRQVGRAIRRNVEINYGPVESHFRNKQVLVGEKLHNVHGSRQRLSRHHGVVLTTRFGIDKQQTVSTHAETRESGEESQFHLPYLMLAGQIRVRCLLSNRRQTFRRKNDMDNNRHRRYNR